MNHQDQQNSPTGWIIGGTHDSRTGRPGLVAKRYDDPLGNDALRVNWRGRGDAREIAACLRDLANSLEREVVTGLKPGEHRQIGPHTAAFRPSVDPQPWGERKRQEEEPGTVRWYFGKPIDGRSE